LVNDFGGKIKHSLDLKPFSIPILNNKIFMVLDLDGTLLDTVDIHEKCYKLTNTKDEKNELFKTHSKFDYIWNSEYIIDFIIDNNINHVILTNTTSISVNHYKKCIPKFNKLTFVTKDDYNNRKPHPEPYECAMKYYKGEECIMYFDDIVENLKPMEKYTNLIFHMSNKQVQQRYYTLNNFMKLKN
jgi:beta-phosphoglucomutase-like phosphatase (HAD superfamily)